MVKESGPKHIDAVSRHEPRTDNATNANELGQEPAESGVARPDATCAGISAARYLLPGPKSIAEHFDTDRHNNTACVTIEDILAFSRTTFLA